MIIGTNWQWNINGAGGNASYSGYIQHSLKYFQKDEAPSTLTMNIQDIIKGLQLSRNYNIIAVVTQACLPLPRSSGSAWTTTALPSMEWGPLNEIFRKQQRHIINWSKVKINELIFYILRDNQTCRSLMNTSATPEISVRGLIRRQEMFHKHTSSLENKGSYIRLSTNHLCWLLCFPGHPHVVHHQMVLHGAYCEG